MGKRAQYPPGTFCWTDLATSDPAGATTFYTELFGWRPEVLPDRGAGAYTLLRLGGALVAALFEAGDGQPPAWLSYVSVADAGATASRATELGATVLRPVADVGSSGRMALLADPAGAVFAAWQPAGHAGAELVNDPSAWCLNQLNTGDPEAAQRFYTELFGWRVEPAGTEEQPYWGLFNDGALNGGMTPLPAGAPGPAHWLVYFAVRQADAAAERIADLGGRVLVAPTVVPSGRILVASDPQGALFAVFEGRVDP